MSDTGSVSQWLRQLKAGEQDALQPIWERYFARLVSLARVRLRGHITGASDEEDVVLSAFDSFQAGAATGRFPRLEDRDDLWQVLLMLTGQKLANALGRERRQKRGGGQVRHLSALNGIQADTGADAFAEVLGREPTPEFAAEVAEECRRLLDTLNDVRLRQLALWKLDGFTNQEIAGRLGQSVATVEGKLALIRKVWSREDV